MKAKANYKNKATRAVNHFLLRLLPPYRTFTLPTAYGPLPPRLLNTDMT